MNDYETTTTKHINIRCHFIRDYSKEGILNLGYSEIRLNISDSLFKA